MKRVEPVLESLQRWMQAVITHPEGVSAGVASAPARDAIAVDRLEAVVLPSRTLTSTERLELYSGMYVERLAECLRDDFPALVFALGAERFDAMARAYVAAHPSTHFSLNQLGARLSQYLSGTHVRRKEFLAELAALERGIQEVFDEQAAVPIAATELQAVAAEDWPRLRLVTAPALRLFAFRYPVNRFYQAFREGGKPRVPAAASSWTAVYRKDFKVWRASLSLEQHALLSALMRGHGLDRALEECALVRGVDLARLGRSLGEWFREWSGEGLFVGLALAAE